jgi:nucleoside 2-deoxyribosyltransferase
MSIESAGLPPLPATMRATVFISHSSKDEAVVRWLAAQVEAAGHAAWVAEREPQPGGSLSGKVLTALADCDAYVLLLTEDGYDSIYVAHEVGAAAASGKPLIALVDQGLAERPMGLLTDVEQVRFDRNDLAASTSAITTGLMRLGEKRGVPLEQADIVSPTQPALFSVSVQMNAQFQVTPDQVLVGVAAFMLIGGLIYMASHEGA